MNGIGGIITGDFGQTLFVWGVPEGPYVVRPYLGPATMRDAVGSTVDMFSNPVGLALARRRVKPLVAPPDFDELAFRRVLGLQNLKRAVNALLNATGLDIRAAVDMLVAIEEIAAIGRHQRPSLRKLRSKGKFRSKPF